MPDDDKIDTFINREAKGYRADSKPPADAMWSRIELDVARAIKREQRSARPWPWVLAGTGIAAALVIGIAIGRNSTNTVVPAVAVGQGATVATGVAAKSDSTRGASMRAITWNHLEQAEVFLTEVRADLTNGRRDPERGDRSRQLLSRTRLLMASDASRAPSVERLLQDLELVLAGIAALPDTGRRASDARVLDEQRRVGTILPRIRTILPPPATGAL